MSSFSHIQLNPWWPDPFRYNLFATSLLVAVMALTVVYDVIFSFGLPMPLLRTLQWLTSPFHNFLLFEDLGEGTTSRPRLPASSWTFRLLVSLPLLEATVYFGQFIFRGSGSDWTRSLSELLASLAWLYASTRIWTRPPSTPPYLLLLFYVLNLVFSSIDILSVVVPQSNDVGMLALYAQRFIVSLVLICIIGNFPVKALMPGLSVAESNEIPSSSKTMPEDSVTLWQWFTFSFVEPIFTLALARRLEQTDVWSLSPFFKHKNLFTKYLDYRGHYPGHSLIRFLIVSNSLDLILDVVLELWSAVASFVSVYALQKILSVMEEKSERRSEAYFFAFITFLIHLSFAQVALLRTWHSRRSYERTRGQLFCALHYKALRRRDLSGKTGSSQDGSNTADDGADLGKIVNLMQGDAYIVSQRFLEASAVFAMTVRLILSLVFLYQVLGWSSMAGVVVVLVAYILNYPLAKYNVHITRESWKAKDTRMSSVNELFQNVRFLKFYGWENHWARKVLERRETELGWRVKENLCAILISFIWIWVPSAMALFSFLFYTVVAHRSLTVSKTFTSLALFSALQGPMTELPEQLFSFLHAYVSMQRINSFLGEEEVPDWASSLMHSPCPEDKLEAIGFKGRATFQWDPPLEQALQRPQFMLGPLDIEFVPRQLSIITGATGSGKSALLSALLGELHCSNGEVFLNKSSHQIAYCAQNPWLEHATIRDNIVFGSIRGYEESRYNAVVESCALRQDLAMFDANDLTEIGEKGVTLSGGQRARIALARALYSEAKCILLDDPLAAVDMHTAQHIVEHCFRGDLMRGRTVILVTHHLSLCLSSASFIVELSGGQVIRQELVKDPQASGQPKTVIDVENDSSDESAGMTNEVDAIDSTDHVWKTNTPPSGKLVEAEHRAEGRVSLYTYFTYIRAAGWVAWVVTLSLMLMIRLLVIANDLFLAKWSEAYEKGHSKTVPLEQQYSADYQSPSVMGPRLLDGLPSPEDNAKPWLLIYLWISLASAVATLVYITLGYYASLQASRKLFSEMLIRLIRAPSRFFDVTPLGRILNRFTTDTNIVDSTLQQSARAALTGCLTFISSFLFIIYVIPQFTPFAILIAWLYIRLAPPYIHAARDLRRLESVSLSPAFAGFDELLRGITHVRAFAMEKRYQEAFYNKVDVFQGMDHAYWLVAGWLRWRYDCLGSVVVFITTLFALWSGASNGFTAIVIVQAGVFAEASRQLVKVAAQLELDFNSVERINEYRTKAPQEARSIINEKRPPAYWPSNSGNLTIENLSVRYAPNLPCVLNGVTFTVAPGEKIGVVGRTGSGKSTLALSLLRIIEPSDGKIVLDGIDISTIGLEDLRTRITIVSQDVSLFTGTIRSNLDPLGEHSDLECWDVLDRCHLTKREEDPQSRNIGSLDSMISPTGSLSAGERQLVALSRAILRHSQVIIMDEATSQIDTVLDDQIQRTIREELSSAMVITIAHRLKTIVDYDRILVLGEGGRVIEFDSPQILMKRQGSAFREMCMGNADWEELRNIVEEVS
ncbi:P-loop containing nucleoside triphosphate hydrolase protein [Phellopilus nigrolimitatus]|nr:P-loop containing nucleoside triphosphate hydrolase protein [Phellopilus nigrolimitatus]